MSLAALADPGPDPALLARFTASPGVPKAVRQRSAFFVFFAETVFAQLAKYRPALVSAYRPLAGRPALEPVRLLAVLVLQFVERLPDRQAMEAMQYDLRWRLALHLQPDENACDPSLLAVFRNRLLNEGQERLVFEAVLALLVTEGWVPKRQAAAGLHACVWFVGPHEPAGLCARDDPSGARGGGGRRLVAGGMGGAVGTLR
jgi:hypothetical protein